MRKLDEHEQAMAEYKEPLINRVLNALMLIISGAAVAFYAGVYILGYFD